MNLSAKPSDAHHAAEGELVCKSGRSHIKGIFFLSSSGANFLKLLNFFNPKRRYEIWVLGGWVWTGYGRS